MSADLTEDHFNNRPQSPVLAEMLLLWRDFLAHLRLPTENYQHIGCHTNGLKCTDMCRLLDCQNKVSLSDSEGSENEEEELENDYKI